MTKKKTGRPTKYSLRLVKELCSLHSDGIPLPEIWDMDHMPAKSTMYEWERDITEFAELLDHARVNFAHAKLDQLPQRLENDARDTYVDNHGRRDLVALKRDELIAGYYKWLAERRLSKKYGNQIKQEITGADGAALIPSISINVRK